jgi:hypothetical protein
MPERGKYITLTLVLFQLLTKAAAVTPHGRDVADPSKSARARGSASSASRRVNSVNKERNFLQRFV